MADSWQYDPRLKLVVPGEHIEYLQKAAMERTKEEKKQFFSDRTPKAYGASEQPMPAQDPLPGSLIGYNAMYQPWNLVGGWRKPGSTVPFQILRDVRRKSVIDNAIINTRQAQVKRFARACWVPKKQVGFRVVHERDADPQFAPDEDILRRCEEVQRRLLNVTPGMHNSIRDMFTMWVEEELVLDRKIMVIYRDEQGRPFQYHTLDGTTVRPRLQVLLPWMLDNNTDNVDIAAEVMSYDTQRNPYNIDLTTAAYVQEIEGRFTAAWTAEQISVDIANPTAQYNQWGYGISLLEHSLEATSMWLYAWNYNRELFKTNFPEAILAILGDYEQGGLEAFKRQVLGEVGPGSNWRLPVITGSNEFKVEMQKLRDTPQEMLMGELLRFIVALKCSAFRMHPSEINFSGDMGTQKMVFAQEDSQAEVATANEQGLHTLMDSFADWITRAFVQQNYDDLIMVWEGIDQPQEGAIITNLTVENQFYKTVDEVRAERGLPPLPDGLGEFINNPVFVQQQEMLMQEQMMEEQAEMYDDGDFGQPEGEGEDGDFGQDDGDKGNSFGGGKDSGSKSGSKGGPFDKQDSASGSDSKQWMAGTTPKKPGAKTVKRGAARKPGQLAPEGNPTDAPFMNEAARGKQFAMKTKKGTRVSVETKKKKPVKKSMVISFMEDGDE